MFGENITLFFHTASKIKLIGAGRDVEKSNVLHGKTLYPETSYLRNTVYANLSKVIFREKTNY